MTAMDPDELTQPASATAQQEGRDARRRQLADDLSRVAAEATDARAQETKAREHQQYLRKRFPQIFPGRPLLWLGSIILSAAPPGIYLVDLVTLFAFAEFFARLAFRTNPGLIPVAVYSLPMVVILLEFWVC